MPFPGSKRAAGKASARPPVVAVLFTHCMKLAQQGEGSALHSAVTAEFVSWLVLLRHDTEQKKGNLL